jgi:hypothetical protein
MGKEKAERQTLAKKIAGTKKISDQLRLAVTGEPRRDSVEAQIVEAWLTVKVMREMKAAPTNIKIENAESADSVNVDSETFAEAVHLTGTHIGEAIIRGDVESFVALGREMQRVSVSAQGYNYDKLRVALLFEKLRCEQTVYRLARSGSRREFESVTINPGVYLDAVAVLEKSGTEINDSSLRKVRRIAKQLGIPVKAKGRPKKKDK